MSGTASEISPLIKNDDINFLSNAYKMFVFSIRSEVTRKYYERRLRHFFNHINFDMENNTNMEVKFIIFLPKEKMMLIGLLHRL